MARGLNKVMLIGNLGRDPEMRYTPTGKPVTAFSLAVNRSWSTAEGERREDAEWFNIVAWGELAERCNKYLRKGERVYVEGRLQTRNYEDKEGKKVYITEVVAEDVLLLGGRGGEAGGEGAPAPVSMPRSAPRQQAAAAAPDAGMDQGVSDDDVPF